MSGPDVTRCEQCLRLLQDVGVTLTMDQIEDRMCAQCKAGLKLGPLDGFPISEYLNDGDIVLFSVDSPDGDFMVTLGKDGAVCLEVFDPQHVVHRGKLI